MIRRHSLAPYIQSFFTNRMRLERNLSEYTIDAYRDTFRLLLNYAEMTLGIVPDKLGIQNLDVELIVKFLWHLENDRKNSISTRNARLAAIRSFFRYVSHREPDLLLHCQQILNLPTKRGVKKPVEYLADEEINAILSNIDSFNWYQKRDKLIIEVMNETGIRVSELTRIRINELNLSHKSSIRIFGKGRKLRDLPIDEITSEKLSKWILLNKKTDTDFLFTTKKGKWLSRDSIERIAKKYSKKAKLICPSIGSKSISPHIFRHTFAMRMLKSGVGLPLVSLWLGHEDIETTMIYVHANMEMKRDALKLVEKLSVNSTHKNVSNEDDASDELRKFLDDL